MIAEKEYLENPCKASSLPFWKTNKIPTPDNMKIVNNRYFQPNQYINYSDTQYFKLIHNLQDIGSTLLSDNYHFSIVDINNDLVTVQDIINTSYDDINVSMEYIISCTAEPVFDNNLWIFIVDNSINKPVGLGIADFDCEIKEGILEWIQLLPQYRRKGLGYALVNKLLEALKHIANFVTVSGKVGSDSNPEKLYRRCGFIGDDIWHVLYAE